MTIVALPIIVRLKQDMHALRLPFTAVIVFVSSLLAPLFIPNIVDAAEPDARRLALVVGNADYAEIGELRNPTRDARAVAERLVAFGFEVLGVEGTVTGKPIIDASRRTFGRALLNFRRVVGDVKPEIAFVYYAGHGMQNGRSSYLLPVDVPADDVELIINESIPLESSIDELDQHAGLTVAIFDACREIPSLQRSIRRLTRSTSAEVSDFRGLQRVQRAGRSRIIAFSGAAGQLVADGSGEHSPYTGLLLEEMDSVDGRPIEDLLQDVAFRFGERHAGQNPEYVTSGVKRDRFFFSRNADSPSEGPTEQSSPPPLELAAWEAAQENDSKASYRTYLDQFPNGTFSAIAKNRTSQLSRENPAKPPDEEVAAMGTNSRGSALLRGVDPFLLLGGDPFFLLEGNKAHSAIDESEFAMSGDLEDMLGSSDCTFPPIEGLQGDLFLTTETWQDSKGNVNASYQKKDRIESAQLTENVDLYFSFRLKAEEQEKRAGIFLFDPSGEMKHGHFSNIPAKRAFPNYTTWIRMPVGPEERPGSWTLVACLDNRLFGVKRFSLKG